MPECPICSAVTLVAPEGELEKGTVTEFKREFTVWVIFMVSFISEGTVTGSHGL